MAGEMHGRLDASAKNLNSTKQAVKAEEADISKKGHEYGTL